MSTSLSSPLHTLAANTHSYTPSFCLINFYPSCTSRGHPNISPSQFLSLAPTDHTPNVIIITPLCCHHCRCRHRSRCCHHDVMPVMHASMDWTVWLRTGKPEGKTKLQSDLAKCLQLDIPLNADRFENVVHAFYMPPA